MKKYLNIIFWSLFIVYLEFIFKISIFDISLDINFFIVITFSIFYSLIIYLFLNTFNNKLNKILSFIVISIFIFIFCSQLIYYKFYLSIFSVFSVSKGGIQIFQFFDNILKTMYYNLIYILLLILPLIIYIFISKKISFNRLKPKSIIILFVSIVIAYISSILLINNIDDNSSYTSKKLYYDIHSPTLTVNKIGLVTTMRLDIKRLIFGFEEKVDIIIPDVIEKEVEEKKIEYNEINIDFDTLISNETNKDVLNMHNYFKSIEPTEKNEYTGLFKDKNLIYILAESFNTIAIDPVLTPTLYKLANESFVFNNYYVPLYPVSTSDGEYIALTSLIPKEGVWSAYRSSNNYFPYTLGNAFKNLNYKTTAYHNHTYNYYRRDLSHQNYGYDYYACGNGLTGVNCKVWPESDIEMMNATMNNYMDNAPFHTYYITVSGHLRYTRVGNYIARKNWSYVKDLNYSESIRSYIACNIELDKALEILIKKLEEKGILDDTVIALTTDHYPYGLTIDEMNERSNTTLTEPFDKHKSTFILWNNTVKKTEISKYVSNLDVLPTLLNLFGVDYDSRILMGRDMLSNDEGLVIFSNRSFISDYGMYNSINDKFTLFNNKNVDDNYVSNINEAIKQKFYISKEVLDNDYYRVLFK